MGGPERLSRVDMAMAVADARGYDRAAIVPAPAASVDRGVASPADISMDISALQVARKHAPMPDNVFYVFTAVTTSWGTRKT